MNNPKKWIAVFFLIYLCSGNAFSQNKQNGRFHSINQAGLLEGEKGGAFQLQTINGMQYKSWFAGLGFGLDYYRFRSLPLFIDLRKSFDPFFVYLDGGIHFIWLSDKEKNDYPGSFSKGFYGDLGGGYALKLSKKTVILFSAGYNYKRSLRTQKFSTEYCPFAGPCNANYNYIRSAYEMSRFNIKAGIQF
jgi:hypothetical protein